MNLSGVFFFPEYAKKVKVKSVRTSSRSRTFFFHIPKKQTTRKASFYDFLTRKVNTVVFFIEER